MNSPQRGEEVSLRQKVGSFTRLIGFPLDEMGYRLPLLTVTLDERKTSGFNMQNLNSCASFYWWKATVFLAD
jgi:hypothetical protein